MLKNVALDAAKFVILLKHYTQIKGNKGNNSRVSIKCKKKKKTPPNLRRSNEFTGIAERSPGPTERRHPNLHGYRPLHVYAAPSQLPQALQQKGKLCNNEWLAPLGFAPRARVQTRYLIGCVRGGDYATG